MGDANDLLAGGWGNSEDNPVLPAADNNPGRHDADKPSSRYAGPSSQPKYGFEAYLNHRINSGGPLTGRQGGSLAYGQGPYKGMSAGQAQEAARAEYEALPDAQKQHWEGTANGGDIRSQREVAAGAGAPASPADGSQPLAPMPPYTANGANPVTPPASAQPVMPPSPSNAPSPGLATGRIGAVTGNDPDAPPTPAVAPVAQATTSAAPATPSAAPGLVTGNDPNDTGGGTATPAVAGAVKTPDPNSFPGPSAAAPTFNPSTPFVASESPSNTGSGLSLPTPFAPPASSPTFSPSAATRAGQFVGGLPSKVAAVPGQIGSKVAAVPGQIGSTVESSANALVQPQIKAVRRVAGAIGGAVNEFEQGAVATGQKAADDFKQGLAQPNQSAAPVPSSGSGTAPSDPSMFTPPIAIKAPAAGEDVDPATGKKRTPAAV